MKYLLYYAGFNNDDGIEQIGLATSHDFLDWNFTKTNPIIQIGSQGLNDELQTSNPCVIKHEGVYKMWYQGKSRDGLLGICYAESKDGVSWQSSKNYLFTIHEQGNINFRDGFHQPHVIFDDTKKIFNIWFTSSVDGLTTFMFASSVDGINWNNVQQTNIISQTKDEKFWYPFVSHNQNGYRMWFTQRDYNKTWKIFHATSKDGVVWKYDIKKPIINNSYPKIIAIFFEGVAKYLNFYFTGSVYGTGSPFVWNENGKYFLISHDVGVRGKLYIAKYESNDGIEWNKIKNNILPKSTLPWDSYFQADPYLYVEK